MTNPSIFISYSHKDEEWKDRVVTHLRVLEMEGMLDVWDDRRIEAGDDWFTEIEQAINAASIAVFLISANFLTSKFIHDEEVSRLLTRREKEGVRVIPIIVKPCAWTQVKWLSPIQARPKDGRALSAGNENQIDTDLAALAEEIAKIFRRVGAIHESPLRVSLPPDKISLAHLPSTSPDLFGREKELKEMDEAWENPQINVMTLVAWGGVGKSALVNKWLTQMALDNYRGAERVYGWSLYSQGAAEGRQVSADQFIASALAWFGDPDPNVGSPWDKGERLAELVKQSRALIILDGLEPLQNPPPVETGRIKDPALVAFLRELARQNPGLVFITTRLAVDDLKDCIGSTAIERDLEALSDEAGAEYLKHLGVDGTEDERKEASHDFGGHALALTLMGSYLKTVHRGDIRKRNEIPHLTDDQKQGSHARRVLESYERWLQGKPELDILRLMGLFDRPAEKGAVDALRKEPVIVGLTDALQKLGEAQWKYAVENLRKLRLLAHSSFDSPALRAGASNAQDELDCHPLLREHFGEQLKEGNPAAWREGNNRLYEYYKTSAKELPDTLQEMTPLFAAVLHGCQAGRHQEALDEVLWKRIRRGQEGFSVLNLGAFGADLAALSGFFESVWRKPVDGLRESDKAFVLTGAGFHLRALGRLVEAVQPIQAGLENNITRQDWTNSAIQASILSELYLTIGNVQQALAYAERSVGLADKSGDEFQRMHRRVRFGDALHQAGQLEKSQTMFREAEEMQKKHEPTFPLLYSMSGFQYCDLLLSQGKVAEVERRARNGLKMHEQGALSDLLSIALDHLSLGRAKFLSSLRAAEGGEAISPSESGIASASPRNDALVYFTRAVDGLRQAADQSRLPLGLLARAEYYRAVGDIVKAQKDLDEAFSIATRGGMGLYLADCHLGYARLNVSKLKSLKVENLSTFKPENVQTDYRAEARKHVAIAKEMIDKMGYHRRDKEVEELEEQLK
ncbi:MAG: TIR domain-containing protein [Chloroflexi bacterium]|nr:TIR domain-containing protein [Chloroflexota bacterium]